MQRPGSLERAWELNGGPLPERTRGLVRAALGVRLLLSRDLVYADVATIGGLVGLVASHRLRRAAAAAMEALGARPNRQAAWRFARAWWCQRVADGALEFQADQLTPAWAAEHVLAPDPLPTDGCVLLAVHHFNQRLAFARLSTAVEELGAVALFEPVSSADPDFTSPGHVLSVAGRDAARSLFADRVFGDRMYRPPFGARRGLELLRRGGSLIVLSDFLGRDLACVLGRQIPITSGAIWFAQQSGRPIVPFVLSPPRGQSPRWHLWCGEPIPPTRPALVAALEDCIRRAPTGWVGWPSWHEAPVCSSR
jgi:hypothetical protein